MQVETAKSVIAQMGGQIDLLITLALGICGGLTALLLQVTLHNGDKNKEAVIFRGTLLLLLCLLCEGASIIFGYLSRGAITSLTPKLLRQDYSKIDNWTQTTFDGSRPLRALPALQGILFIVGIVLVLLFVVANVNLHRSMKRNEATTACAPPVSRDAPCDRD